MRRQARLAAIELPTLPPFADDYLANLQFERRLAAGTIDHYRRDLNNLAQYAEAKQDPRRAVVVSALSSNDIRRFLAAIHSKGMSPRAIARMLSGWRGYFNFLIRQHGATINPCEGVRAPKAAKKLPRTLSIEEAIHLVSAEDDSINGIRDHAAFELLYSCGMRIGELVGLNLDSVNFSSAEVRVTGKGNKTRIIPVGKPALDALQQWLRVRSSLKIKDKAAMFLGKQGGRINASVLQRNIKRCALRRGIDINVHPHMLRHSFASHVLQSSQNLRAVQEMMGHASIASTQVYTHLDFQHLAKVYDASHPRAIKAARKKDKAS